MKIDGNIHLTLFLMFSLVMASCSGSNKQTSQETTEVASQNDETTIQKQTEMDWVYTVSEDKLNDVKNYQANIISTNGKMMLQVSAMDLFGDGNYNTVIGLAWDETYSTLRGETMIGVKFPNDEKWEKIGVKCEGRAASLSLRFPQDMVKKLIAHQTFKILHFNEEFEFSPSKPLEWNH